MSTQHKKFYKRKRFIVPFALLLLLIAFRLYLPTLVKNYVNKVLADIPGYYGQVEDIDIALYRGAYVIKGMYLNRVDAKTEIPFLKFPQSDISVEWNALFKGKIVSEIIMTNPEVIYVFEDQQAATGETTEVEDWTEALTDLVPIAINHFEVHNGKLAFLELQADPNVDLNINSLELTADNLRNVKSNDKTLPSPITATGISFGGGRVSLEGGLNLIKEIPDMDISFSLEGADATALNDLTNYYSGTDFAEGEFNFYSEIAIADANLKGYVKPMLTDTKFISKEDKFLSVLWEGFVGFFKFIFKNQGTDTFALKVPLEGDLNQPDVGIWSTFTSIFRNAWIKAFKSDVDNEINFEDAFKEAQQEEKKKERKGKGD